MSAVTPRRSPQSQQGSVLGLMLLIVLIVAIIALAIYTVYLNNTIVSKFENRRWDVPASLYSRPLALQVGQPLSASDLESWLEHLRYSQNGTDKTGSFKKSGEVYTIHTRGFAYGDGDTEAEQLVEITIKNNKVQAMRTTVPNRSGIVRLEPIYIGGIYPSNNEDRKIITHQEVPKALIDALIATEDRGFYEHYGISVRGIARAIIANTTGGQTQGGSTITQQLVKNFYLNADKTVKRKATEALMAILLESHYSKDDILLAYMNEINLGQNGNRSVNGFGIASQFYFDKPLKELTLEQHALLVGIAKGPSYYNPRKNPERAKQRRDTVLQNMYLTGKIDEATYQKAISKPLGVVKTPAIAKMQFPDFVDAVQRELKAYYREEDLQNRGLKIISTLDPLSQAAADKAISKELGKLRSKGGKTKDLQGALVSANPQTGELLALVGSSDEFTGFNRAIDAKRQVGSLLKPVIYLTAFSSGRYQLTTPVNDSSVSYTVGGKKWTPKNYGGSSHGSVPAISALANSYNQAAVNLGMEFGVPAFVAQMQNLSITSQIPPYPSVMLGAIDLSPMQVLGMYQIFANGGAYTPIHTVRTVMNDQGKVLQRAQIRHQFRAPPEAVYLLNRGLQEVISLGTAKAAKNIGKDLHLAGKTGTTNDHRDAWFAGYSGNYVSVVWIGRDDNKPIGLSGGTGALPIWSDYMKRLNLTAVALPQPAGVSWQWLDRSGYLTYQHCSGAQWLPIINAYTPAQADCGYTYGYDGYDYGGFYSNDSYDYAYQGNDYQSGQSDYIDSTFENSPNAVDDGANEMYNQAPLGESPFTDSNF